MDDEGAATTGIANLPVAAAKLAADERTVVKEFRRQVRCTLGRAPRREPV
jgi:hypothetical protein